MATMLTLSVPYSFTRFFKAGRMVGIFGWFVVANLKTRFLIFKMNRTTYRFVLDHHRRKS